MEAVGSSVPVTRPDLSTGGSFSLLIHCLPGVSIYLYTGYLYVCVHPRWKDFYDFMLHLLISDWIYEVKTDKL